MGDRPRDICTGPRGIDVHTLTIPRGEVAMAAGTAAPDASSLELVATQGLDTRGTCSAPFLDHAFRTTEFRIRVALQHDGTWSDAEATVLRILGRPEPFRHTDRHRLAKVGEPVPNALAR